MKGRTLTGRKESNFQQTVMLKDFAQEFVVATPLKYVLASSLPLSAAVSALSDRHKHITIANSSDINHHTPPFDSSAMSSRNWQKSAMIGRAKWRKRVKMT
jgi:hypothetical protein